MNVRRWCALVSSVGLVVALAANATAVASAGKPAVQPEYLPYDNTLDAVSAVSAKDVWAVGASESRNVIFHWDGTRWKEVASAHPDHGGQLLTDQLSSVSADSPTDAWAVGHSEYRDSHGQTQLAALVEHWDGTRWAVAHVPPVGTREVLASVDALSPTDVWVVGEADSALIEHWDGTSWTQMSNQAPLDLTSVSADSATDAWASCSCRNEAGAASPVEHWDGTAWNQSPTSVRGVIDAVSAESPTDVWAVGHHARAGLVEHFDGTAWAKVATPDAGPGTVLRSVTTLSPTDAWAVGDYIVGSADVALIEHWDGTSWTQVTSPSGDGSPLLLGVAAVAGNDIWAVGFTVYEHFESGAEYTLTEHWDGGHWVKVQSPNPGRLDDLMGVSADGSNDVWAVGYNGVNGDTLAEHSDGTTWRTVRTPSPGGLNRSDQLLAVSADSPTDAWAVGSTGSIETLPFIQHWDGAAWTIVPGAPVVRGSELSGVEALSPTDVWAVGTQRGKTLVEHWDGSAWTRVASPNKDDGDTLYAVSAASPTDVWAVGLLEAGNVEETLVEHWDGSTWTRVPSPSPGGSNGTRLNGVSAVSADDVWAVGRTVGQTLAEHWDGTRWAQVASPGDDSTLNGVSAASSDDVWAVGTIDPGDSDDQTLIDHWDGTSWTQVPSANPGVGGGALQGVAAVSATDAWAVGSFYTDHAKAPLIEHWDGTSWTAS